MFQNAASDPRTERSDPSGLLRIERPMSDEHNDAERIPSLEELLEHTNDPSVLLSSAWWEAATRRIEFEVARALAASPELARAATPESARGLIDMLGRAAERYGARAFG